MNKRDLARFRKILGRKREEVAGQIAQLELNYSNGPNRDSSGYGIHMAETGSDEEQLEKNLAFLSQEGDILQLIDDALSRIDSLRYGVCEGCGEGIPKERLLAKPFARYCISCRREMETSQRTK
ncbi:MAG: TraR/DksA C4-type zinc finger protein [bacterium]